MMLIGVVKIPFFRGILMCKSIIISARGPTPLCDSQLYPACSFYRDIIDSEWAFLESWLHGHSRGFVQMLVFLTSSRSRDSNILQ